MAKKIVLVIVEGQSDDTALGLLLDEFFDPRTVRVHIVRGDVTTDVYVNEIISRVNTEINKYCERDHVSRDIGGRFYSLNERTSVLKPKLFLVIVLIH